MGTTARLLERAGTRTVWLELDYDGLDPPTTLFSDLALLGWRPPAAASPPHEAIDWATPDLARGLDHTIRPWRVVGAAVGPPAGSGPRGAWTDADAATFVPLLHRVLARHQVPVAGHPAAPGGGATPPAATAAPPSPSPPALPASPAARGTTAGDETSTTPTKGDSSVRLLSLVVEAEQGPAVREVLEAARLPFSTANAKVSVPQRYRGREFVAEVDGVRFEVVVPAHAVDEVRRSLAALGVDERLARLTIEPLEPSGGDDPDLAEVHPFRRTRGVA